MAWELGAAVREMEGCPGNVVLCVHVCATYKINLQPRLRIFSDNNLASSAARALLQGVLTGAAMAEPTKKKRVKFKAIEIGTSRSR